MLTRERRLRAGNSGDDVVVRDTPTETPMGAAAVEIHSEKVNVSDTSTSQHAAVITFELTESFISEKEMCISFSASRFDTSHLGQKHP